MRFFLVAMVLLAGAGQVRPVHADNGVAPGTVVERATVQSRRCPTSTSDRTPRIALTYTADDAVFVKLAELSHAPSMDRRFLDRGDLVLGPASPALAPDVDCTAVRLFAETDSCVGMLGDPRPVGVRPILEPGLAPEPPERWVAAAEVHGCELDGSPLIAVVHPRDEEPWQRLEGSDPRLVDAIERLSQRIRRSRTFRRAAREWFDAGGFPVEVESRGWAHRDAFVLEVTLYSPNMWCDVGPGVTATVWSRAPGRLHLVRPPERTHCRDLAHVIDFDADGLPERILTQGGDVTVTDLSGSQALFPPRATR